MKEQVRQSEQDGRYFKGKTRELMVGMVTVIFAVLVLYLFLYLSGVTEVPYVNIGADATGDLYDVAGTPLAQQVPPKDWVLRYGQSVQITLPLPDKAPYDGSNDLVFWIYNATVDVSLDGKTLLKAGYDRLADNQLIGNQMLNLELPDKAFGSSLQITVTSWDHNSNSFETNFRIMRTQDIRLYPLIDDLLPILLFFLIAGGSLIASAWVLINMLIGVRKGYHAQELTGLCLFLFCFLISVWYLGYKRAFYVFFLNSTFSATAEYLAMYLMMIPVCIYFIRVSDSRPFRIFCKCVCIAFLADAAISFTLSASPIPLDLSDVVRVYWVILIILIIGFIVRAVMVQKEEMSMEKILVNGIAISALIASLQILANRLRAIPGIPDSLHAVLYFDYAAVGILLFITTMVSTYVMKLQDEMSYRIHLEEAEKLAYLDILTGIHNRAWILKEKLPSASGRIYTVVFLDVDHLKYANDQFGHEMGDRLLVTAAGSIRDACSNTAAGDANFYGRWGGDEFVAFFAERDQAQAFEEALFKELADINRQKSFPFPVSISAGMETGPLGENLIEQADQHMYENKQLHHRQLDGKAQS
ncbi:MAG: GGDEF domain-containing protein [Lachnospiraceae bacterium]